MAKRTKRSLTITRQPKPPHQGSAGHRQPSAAQLRKAAAAVVAEIMPPSKFEQLQMQVIELASRMHAIQQQLGELTIPSADEVEELKARFRTASTYVDQVRQQVSAPADARKISAQAIRASLLARAIAATLVGRRANNVVSQGRWLVPWSLA
jgi:hypothetical protein